MDDAKELMKRQFNAYASYVAQERAIPHVDGLKPVQRRFLWTLFEMDDGKFHKVANVVGQTMALHPHGDAAITEALTNLANKGYLLDTQGNFGNLLTGDPAAAARYIETRLSQFAKETLFNKDLTTFGFSYDGRKEEPVALPVKIPLLLLQGADGIAVGLATHIFPHNFQEVIEAEIAYLEGNPKPLLPDFFTGGLMDASEYADGRGKLKLRAKIEVKDPKTLVIREIPFGTTTESLIRSIDEAGKKGKIKLESIHDYTASHVEIEIKLPRGAYAEELVDALFAFTDCEVTLHSLIIVIRDSLPWECSISELLAHYAELLQDLIRRELEIERDRLQEKIFFKSLERIFIENRLYKKIEEISDLDEIHKTVATSLAPFHKKLLRIPTHDDRERLLSMAIRRISRFDLKACEDEIAALEAKLEETEKALKDVKKVAIRYLKGLLQRYGKQYPRRTQIASLHDVDVRAIAAKDVRVGVDMKGGYVGTKVTGDFQFRCTNFDKILAFFDDGTYKVIQIPEKKFLPETAGRKLVWVGVADKKTTMSVLYRDAKTKIGYAKRFCVTQFILDKEYRYFDEGMRLEFFSDQEAPVVTVFFIPKPRQRVNEINFDFKEVLIKGVQAKGARVAPQEVKRVRLLGDAQKEPEAQLLLFGKSGNGS